MSALRDLRAGVAALAREIGALRMSTEIVLPADVDLSEDMERELQQLITRAQDRRNWLPETAGDSLIGRIVDGEMRETRLGECPVIVIEDRAGQEWSVLCSTVIRRAMERKGISYGDLIGIVYLGEVKSDRTGLTYRNYQVIPYRTSLRRPLGELLALPAPDTDAA